MDDIAEQPLFQPQDIESSATFRFLRKINDIHGLDLKTYYDLYKWSTAHLDLFWGQVWDETGVVGQKGSHVVDNAAPPVANPTWYGRSEPN